MRLAMKRFPVWLLVFTVVALTVNVIFYGLRLVTPSDGARLRETEPIFTREGVILAPFQPQTSGLRDGDVVTAVAGRSMESWARALFRPGTPRLRPAFGDTVTYSVLRDGQPLEISVKLERYPFGAVLARHGGALLFAFVSQVVAGFVFVRRPDEPAARVLFIWAMSGSHAYAWSLFLQVSDFTGGVGFWLFHLATPGLWLVYWPAALHLTLIFPKPLPVVRRFRLLIPAIYLFSFAVYGTYLAVQWPFSDNVLDWFSRWPIAEGMIAALYLLLVLLIVTVQYRTSPTGSEREQVRWVIFAALVSGSTGLLFWIMAPLVLGRSILSANMLGLLMLPFPISLALAIWRHQLFDIQLIVRRTLVYSVLTAVLALVYFSSVVLLQGIFAPASDKQPTIAIVLSTLAIATLFNPLRRRVQDVIDRRFYRRRYDAEKTLAAFAAKARDEVELEQLTAELLHVVEETMRPAHVSLWLRELEG